MLGVFGQQKLGLFYLALDLGLMTVPSIATLAHSENLARTVHKIFNVGEEDLIEAFEKNNLLHMCPVRPQILSYLISIVHHDFKDQAHRERLKNASSKEKAQYLSKCLVCNATQRRARASSKQHVLSKWNYQAKIRLFSSHWAWQALKWSNMILVIQA
jgi:hypothetical protein